MTTLFDHTVANVEIATTPSVGGPERPHPHLDQADRDWLAFTAEHLGQDTTRSQAWDVARVLSPRSTLRIHTPGVAANAYSHTADLALATAPERPWAMYLADDTGQYWYLVLDLDAHGTYTPFQVATDTTAITTALAQNGIAHLVCESGPTGGRHIWIALRTPVDGETARAFAMSAKSLAPSLDTMPLSNPATGCVRPPLAPHRLGGGSTILSGHLATLTSPTTTISQVQAFTAAHTTAMPTPTRSTTVDPDGHVRLAVIRRELPAKTKMLIETGDDGSDNPDLSRVSWTIAASAARCGWSFDEFKELLGKPGLISVVSHNRGIHQLRTRRRDVERYARRLWAKAVHAATFSSGTATPKGINRREAIDNYIQDVVLPRIQSDVYFTDSRLGGPVTMRVLLALTELTRQATIFDIGADVRRLAVMAGCSHETAARSLQRLQDRGYIFQVAASSGRHAAIWSIRQDTDVETLSTSIIEEPLTQGRMPALAQRCLTPKSISAWLAASTHDAFATGLHAPAAANQWANTQLDVELPIDKEACAEWEDAFAGMTLEAIAQLRGTVGILETRKHNYAMDRLVWQWWCQEKEFLNSKGSRMWHRRDNRWFTGKADKPTRGRFPRTGDGKPDFTAARMIVVKTG